MCYCKESVALVLLCCSAYDRKVTLLLYARFDCLNLNKVSNIIQTLEQYFIKIMQNYWAPSWSNQLSFPERGIQVQVYETYQAFSKLQCKPTHGNIWHAQQLLGLTHFHPSDTQSLPVRKPFQHIVVLWSSCSLVSFRHQNYLVSFRH